MPDITWTAREALACAYCWSEFGRPEDLPTTPERYWLSITEKARNECRAVANRLLLLAVARGEAVAITHPAGLSDQQIDGIAGVLGLQRRSRVCEIIRSLWLYVKSQQEPHEARSRRSTHAARRAVPGFGPRWATHAAVR